jgi:hypothetical protein
MSQKIRECSLKDKEESSLVTSRDLGSRQSTSQREGSVFYLGNHFGALGHPSQTMARVAVVKYLSESLSGIRLKTQSVNGWTCS